MPATRASGHRYDLYTSSPNFSTLPSSSPRPGTLFHVARAQTSGSIMERTCANSSDQIRVISFTELTIPNYRQVTPPPPRISSIFHSRGQVVEAFEYRVVEMIIHQFAVGSRISEYESAFRVISRWKILRDSRS